MNRTLLAALLLIVTAGCSAEAGECVGPATRWQPCARCTLETSKATRRDTPCYVGISVGSAADVLLSQRVIGKPAHGTAETAGATYTYSPAKGFVGQDSFKTERVFLRGEGAFVTYMVVHIDVTH
jgi:hypothetical protein